MRIKNESGKCYPQGKILLVGLEDRSLEIMPLLRLTEKPSPLLATSEALRE